MAGDYDIMTSSEFYISGDGTTCGWKYIFRIYFH